jgi:nonsense-mediated mRNA decay protein 3
MSFCVECGKEGPTLGGVCADDFQRKHVLVRGPEYLDVVRCAHCGRLERRGRWTGADFEDVAAGLLADRVEVDPQVAAVRFDVRLRPVDERNLDAQMRATSSVGPWELESSFRTHVRVRPGACPTCSKQKGRYFVGTVQVRADGRPLTEDEVRRVREIVDRSASGEEFVSLVEEVRGGLDIKVSSNQFAKRLAAGLSKALGGTVGSSATLHTQREGREQYRATYAVRLPGYREGDAIRWRRAKYVVVGLGDPVRLENAATGERLRVRARDLRSARVAKP